MMTILPIPAFDDNYIWLLSDHDGHAVVVDPGDATPVEDWLSAHDLILRAILVTHHHGDHVGGIDRLSQRHGCPVFGPADEAIAGLSHRLREGDRVNLERPSLQLRVLDVPGHTAGHIAYVGDGFAFVGDTLFAGGCGRLFEGTAAQMFHSLEKLAALPASTQIYCAHEYTLANLRFALAVEPDNAALQERWQRVSALRERGEPSIPSLLGEEITTNPFLRCRVQSVAAAARRHHPEGNFPTPDAVFAEIRRWKDSFR